MPSYMINGFEIEQIKPAPWELVLTWSHGEKTKWAAATRQEALDAQRKITLRPTLMARLELVNGDNHEVLWDTKWPRETYGDLLGLPDDLHPSFLDVIMNAIDRERDLAAGRCM